MWLIVNGEQEKRIMLSNDNQLDTDCEECVFKAADIAPTGRSKAGSAKS